MNEKNAYDAKAGVLVGGFLQAGFGLIQYFLDLKLSMYRGKHLLREVKCVKSLRLEAGL